MSFLFDPANVSGPGYDYFIDASTFQMASSGFLGSFFPTYNSDGTIRADMDHYALTLFSGLGEEIDLEHWGFPPGTNTMDMVIYSCRSAECLSAFPDVHRSSAMYWPATYETTTVVPVGVPEGSSGGILLITAPLCFALLCFALLCFALICFALLCFAACRWNHKLA